VPWEGMGEGHMRRGGDGVGSLVRDGCLGGDRGCVDEDNAHCVCCVTRERTLVKLHYQDPFYLPRDSPSPPLSPSPPFVGRGRSQ
jgi:hypothetical protein